MINRHVYSFFIFCPLSLFFNPIPGFAADQNQFTISGPNLKKSFSRKELLASKDLRSITVEKDPSYGGAKMTYSAVPLASLFGGVNTEAMSSMSFKCLDGFSGIISKARVLNTNPNASIAYLAIEKEGQAWPKLNPNKPETAGPFYLIWENPEKSKIMTEEWPYQLAGFELSEGTFESQFPLTTPDKKISAEDPVRRGYHLFMTNCFVCHSLNGEGGVKIGPDLNVPFGPSEYFQFKYFSTLVRNPQNLRKWDQARMPGFSSSSLSDKDLNLIWQYFHHMSKRKAAKNTP